MLASTSAPTPLHACSCVRRGKCSQKQGKAWSLRRCQDELEPAIPNPSRATVAVDRRQALASLAVLSSPFTCATAARAAYVNEDSAQQVFASCARSVVAIEDYTVGGSTAVSNEAVGSGFVWSDLGYIVTNYHCVARLARDKSGQERTKVTFVGDDGSSTSYPATIVGSDATHDLAVLYIDAPRSQLVPVVVGSSKELKVGQSVYAIGNPSGLARTQTSGVVSGLNRAIPSPVGVLIPGAIQTDASINAGNSGGPLLDSFGRLVGVNTATFTRQGTGRGSGVNFALPSDLVVQIVPRLIVYGSAGVTVNGVEKI